MENQINVGNNSEQNIDNQSPSPIKTKVNYWMISTIILLFVVFLELFWFNKETILSGIISNRSGNNGSSSSKSTSSLSDDKSEWKTITSERAKFSFKYPTPWPIDFEPDEELKNDNLYYDENNPDDTFNIEMVDFTEEWYRSAGGERYGFILAWKQKDINTLDDYVKSFDKETEEWAKGATVKIPRPKIKYSVIGGEVAVTEYPQGSFGSLDSPNIDLDFVVVKNGMIYRFAAIKSDPFMQNEEQNSKIFREIISSIKFLE